ncbi:MAG: phosphotransferase family protein [Vulcanimicrobiaceae bacterium]
MDDTIAIRPGEALDRDRLEPYLRERLPEATGPFAVRQFGGGMANLTYDVRFGDRAYVLRRPPHGPLPEGSHDMRREYRVLSKLYAAFPLAPRAFVLCCDPQILGCDFVVMERRRGIVIRETLPARIAGDAPACRRLAERFVDVLAALHGVDYEATGLGDLGRPAGYLERQLEGWIRRWHAAETPGQPDAAALIATLVATRPVSGPPGIVHNDFKLDNAIVDADDPTRFVAVLDWDMCTIGDPLVDLGNVLSLWREAGDAGTRVLSAMPTEGPGFLTRDGIVERYAAATGRDCARATWYHAFSVFRYAAIAQQIYARFASGRTRDARFRDFGRFVAADIERGNALADRGL